MQQELDQTWISEAIGRVKEKMNWVSEKSQNKIPYSTVNGIHDDRSEGKNIFSWCNGFWSGMMWLMYQETGEEKYARIARIVEEKLDRCFEEFYGLHHDVGFMYLLTAVADYRLTGSQDGRRRGLHAATLLAGRFNPAGNFIRAWNDPYNGREDTRGWSIIDTMLNLPLLYWASEETKDPRFCNIAMLHADTVMEHFVRPDGSVRHIVEFDPETGRMVRDHGGQGYEQGSSWTRGQSWGLYGFLMSYRHTGKQEYLDTCKRIAHYFISNIPENGLIPVDFRQPVKPGWCDDSAAAIAACGLLELAEAVTANERQLYDRAALKLLKALYEQHCDFTRQSDCIVQRCTGSYYSEEHEFPLIYGDYYFMEALFKLNGNHIFLW